MCVRRHPGMRYKHYAPKADLTIIQGEMERVIPEINRLAAEQEKAGKKVGVICTDETREQYTTGDIKSIGCAPKMRRSRITCLRFCATSMRTAWK